MKFMDDVLKEGDRFTYRLHIENTEGSTSIRADEVLIDKKRPKKTDTFKGKSYKR